MNAANKNPEVRIIPVVRRTAAAAAFLAVFLAAAAALAIDQPPPTAPQQRAWLVSHLVADMQSVGTFQSSDIAQMVTLVNSLTDSQAGLLAQYYYLTREKTEQDSQLYALQQTGAQEALAQARAQVADLLARLQGQIQQMYTELVAVNPACQTLCQIAYASVPGWCAYNQYAIPDWYYTGGCYVGPAYSAGYCGAYAVPLYNAFYNRGGRYNFWSSRAYLHNSLVRIGRASRYTPSAAAAQRRDSLTRPGTVAVGRKSHAVARASAGVKKVNHVRSRAAAHNRPRSAARPKTGAKVHTASRPHRTAHARHAAHAASHPKHMGHAASHPKHAGRAHSSGHGRRK
jgi:hypothetical protein